MSKTLPDAPEEFLKAAQKRLPEGVGPDDLEDYVTYSNMLLLNKKASFEDYPRAKRVIDAGPVAVGIGNVFIEVRKNHLLNQILSFPGKKKAALTRSEASAKSRL